MVFREVEIVLGSPVPQVLQIQGLGLGQQGVLDDVVGKLPTAVLMLVQVHPEHSPIDGKIRCGDGAGAAGGDSENLLLGNTAGGTDQQGGDPFIPKAQLAGTFGGQGLNKIRNGAASTADGVGNVLIDGPGRGQVVQMLTGGNPPEVIVTERAQQFQQGCQIHGYTADRCAGGIGFLGQQSKGFPGDFLVESPGDALGHQGDLLGLQSLQGEDGGRPFLEQVLPAGQAGIENPHAPGDQLVLNPVQLLELPGIGKLIQGIHHNEHGPFFGGIHQCGQEPALQLRILQIPGSIGRFGSQCGIAVPGQEGEVAGTVGNTREKGNEGDVFFGKATAQCRHQRTFAKAGGGHHRHFSAVGACDEPFQGLQFLLASIETRLKVPEVGFLDSLLRGKGRFLLPGRLLLKLGSDGIANDPDQHGTQLFQTGDFVGFRVPAAAVIEHLASIAAAQVGFQPVGAALHGRVRGEVDAAGVCIPDLIRGQAAADKEKAVGPGIEFFQGVAHFQFGDADGLFGIGQFHFVTQQGAFNDVLVGNPAVSLSDEADEEGLAALDLIKTDPEDFGGVGLLRCLVWGADAPAQVDQIQMNPVAGKTVLQFRDDHPMEQVPLCVHILKSAGNKQILTDHGRSPSMRNSQMGRRTSSSWA